MRARALLRGAAFAAWMGLSACAGPVEKPAPENALHEIDLRELPPENMPGGLFGEADPSLREVLDDIVELAHDEKSKGLFVRLGPLEGGWGVRHDLAHALNVYRSTDKPLHCHFVQLDNVGYALAASSCDRISVSPSGTLNLVGLAMQIVHAQELLSSLGVQAELLQVGRYKGAAEPFTRTHISEPLKKSLDALLDDLDAQFRAAVQKRVAQGNPVADGPYSAQDALEAGLVDAVEYDDAARAQAKREAQAENHVALHEPEQPEPFDFGKLWKAVTSDPGEGEPKGNRLAYVVLEGEIIDGQDPALERVVADPTVRELRRLADAREVKAVVVRIDSPGGSAVASDRIWHALRRVAARKPVAVSVGDMAASGGYYIASGATRIFAPPASLVGSIGVVGGKINMEQLATRYGVTTDTLSRGPHATWLSPLRGFSESERERLKDLLQRTYRLFLHRVSVGRDMRMAEVQPHAEGRLMSGSAAHEAGLVDALGSLQEAVVWARQQAGLPDEAPVEVWPDEENAFAALSTLLKGVRGPLDGAQLKRIVLDSQRDLLPTWVRTLGEGQHAAAALPVQLRLR